VRLLSTIGKKVATRLSSNALTPAEWPEILYR